MNENERPFWALSAEELLARLGSRSDGLTATEAQERRPPPERGRDRRDASVAAALLGQFKSPIILILVFAAALAGFLGDAADAVIILAIVFASGVLGFWQEYRARDAVARLLRLVQVRAAVLRAGHPTDVGLDEIVPGDVVQLNAGDLLPGDGRLLAARTLFVNEAALTGETFPAEKLPGVLPPDTPLARRSNAVFMGTHVVSGTATVVIVRTGRATEFGAISERLRLRPPETEFERGARRFGTFLLEVTLVLLLGIFAANVWLHRPVLDSFLFALALAVGLTPQLLPAVIAVNLAYGARRMARARVIVKRLAVMEDFGAMTVLCCDKTGTLTEGVVTLRAALDIDGQDSPRVLRLAALNAAFQGGFTNPIDAALVNRPDIDRAGCRKLDEEPYDFVRKLLSVLIADGDRRLIITKGALANVLAVCTEAETTDGRRVSLATVEPGLRERAEAHAGDGYRVLGVAYRDRPGAEHMTRADEAEMVFLGLLVLEDRPKAGVSEAIERLRALGVQLKIITGDGAGVAASVARRVGLPAAVTTTGTELRAMSDEALRRRVTDIELFAAVEPNQKERIIRALRQSGQVVGYIGDGINDASALHAADVGISVDDAVDVAKEAADIVLLEHDLGVLVEGVESGRTTFANTLKYVFMAASANFGNMFSMAGASLFLPFLPLLPKQILLTNLLTDLPEMTIPTDRVDRELLERPRRWDIGFIRRFMLTFGLISSVFDYLTFGALLWLLHADAAEFRTGWFVESVISAAVIVLVIRTRRPFIVSRPSRPLALVTVATAAVTLALPYSPLAPLLGFVPLPPEFLALLAAILALYVAAAELAKRLFYTRQT